MLIETNISYSHLVEKFAKFLIDELEIQPRRIRIESYEVDDDTLGMCIDENEEEFIILVKETNRDIAQIFNTIAHEMIHVKQYMKENLNDWLYSSTTPYRECWWEVEAYSKSVPLVEKFAKTL